MELVLGQRTIGMRREKLTNEGSTMTSYQSLIIFISMSTLAAISGLYFQPLWVEDTTVLFHRANYTEFPVFFHYAGYISGHPQLIAQLVTGFEPFTQAFIYSLSALGIWILMLTYLVASGCNNLVTSAFLGYIFVFDNLYIYNLTYSLWPSVAIIGLVSLVALQNNRGYFSYEIALVTLLSLASPLSLFFAPLTFMVAWRFSKSFVCYIPFVACLSSYFILKDSEGAQLVSILAQFYERLSYLIDHPSLYFKISGARLPISPPNVFRSASLAGTIFFIFLYVIPKFRQRYRNYILFAIGASTIFAISTIRVPPGEVLRARYYFPVIIFSICFVSRFQITEKLLQLPRLWNGAFSLSILSVALFIGVFEKSRSQESQSEFVELSSFRWQYKDSVLIQRSGPFNKSDWTVALGNFSFTESQCSKEKPHDDNFVFQIYCNSGSSIRVYDAFIDAD